MPRPDARIVTVKVTTADGKDNRAAPAFIEVDRGAGPVRESGRDIVVNKGEERFELLPGHRLVIEGFTPEAIVYDREQGAAIRPDQQKNDSGKADAPKPAAPDQKTTPQPGASPTESQDSRVKSSPGTTVTPGMAATPSPNTGAPPSTPQGAQTADQANVAANRANTNNLVGGAGVKKDEGKK